MEEETYGMTWLRGPARLEEQPHGGLRVVLDRARAEEYQLTWSPELLYAVVGIRHPTDVLGIVRRHGLLNMAPVAVELSPWIAEPLHWWNSLSLELNRILGAYRALRSASRGEPDGMDRLRAFARMEPAIRPVPPDDTDLLHAVSLEVGRSVSRGLHESNATHYVVPTPEDPARFVFSPFVENLEGLVWQELATEITTNTPMRDCLECGRVFPVKDQRQRYCTNQCAGRVRARRFHEKKKREEQP